MDIQKQQDQSNLVVTDSSWIDWDDQQRLENLVKKQKTMEQERFSKGFDLQSYFGGIEIDNLEDIPKDSRLSGNYSISLNFSIDMFKNEMDEFKVKSKKCSRLNSHNTSALAH